MATTAFSLNDLMKRTSYPAGGGLTLTPGAGISKFAIQAPANSPIAQSLSGKLAISPEYRSLMTKRVTPTVPSAGGPVDATSPAGQVGPVNPTGATGAISATGRAVPPQWLKEDGSFKTPDEIANDVGSTLHAVHGRSDIGKIAGDQFSNPNGGTAADAEVAARRIANTRNDIAVGESDPYHVGATSGIAFTPDELNAIEKAYAGTYDPALDTALAKVNQKKQEEQQKNTPFTLGKDDVRYDGNGKIIAVGVPSGSTAAGSYVAGADPTADAWVKFVHDGGDISKVPDTYKNVVAQGIANVNQNNPLSKTSVDAIGIINQLQSLDDLNDLSGTGVYGGIRHPSSLFPGTEVQNTQNLAKQLQSTLSLANRQQLKGQGAISDFEFRVLGNAASALGLNENGRTNLSPEDFKKQLNMLKVRLSVGETKALTDDEVQALSAKGYSPDQIRDYDRAESGFNPVGNTSASNKTSMNIPQRNNNPGNVKAGGLADSLAIGKDSYGHLIFKSPEDGFKALTADLTAKINGGSSHLPANPTIAQLGSVYAEDPKWGEKVAAILKVPVTTPTKQIPIDILGQAIARQEGFYA